jgi:DNA-directed RNA polymerase specialized sigma24 family protein
VLLPHFEKLSNEEAAQVLGLKRQAASSRHARALKRLKEILAPWSGFGDSSAGR